MKPFITLARTETPDGSQFTLQEHDGEFYLKLNGKQLMSTIATSSELLLADLSCKMLRDHVNPQVLIGGLGLGFSLKRVLELTGPGAKVEVAELLPEVVAWNREFLGKVNGPLLQDPRVKVQVGDVYRSIQRVPKGTFDAILLDVDNGPTSFVQQKNSRIYDRTGLGQIARALKPTGKVAFWSATKEPGFVETLKRAGFLTNEYPAKAYDLAKRHAHVIYVAERLVVEE